MPNKKYMSFEDIRLATPLQAVKRAADGRDMLAVPVGIIDNVKRFLTQDGIEFHETENPALYEDLPKDIAAYARVRELFEESEYVLLITPFDHDAFFDWTLQIFGENMDASFRAYLDSEKKRGEDYYNNLYEYRP